MKLKKIASLMLAGIMAVSMLAGCKSGTPDPENNGGASSNTTSSFTQSVLSKTNAKTSALLKASSNDKLDKAIAFAAEAGYTSANGYEKVDAIDWAENKNWTEAKLANTVMEASNTEFLGSIDNDTSDFSSNAGWKNTTKTYWTVGIVSASLNDDAIADLVAATLDAESFAVDSNNDTYDYEVRVAKAVCQNADKASAKDDYVIVGIAITCTHATVKY